MVGSRLDPSLEREVLDAFLAAADARSQDAFLEICREHPDLLSEQADAYLAERDLMLRKEGYQGLEQVTFARLRIRALREGRDLEAAYDALRAADSPRAVRDCVVAEPLLLDPLFAGYFSRLIRGAGQQGIDTSFAEHVRQLLIDFSHSGVDAGYFDWLVEALTMAPPEQLPALRERNLDLIEPFLEHVHARSEMATRVGDSDRMQKLLYAAAAMNGQPEGDISQVVTDETNPGALASLVLSEPDPADWYEILRDSVQVGPVSTAIAASVVRNEIDQAALERDIVTVREWWVKLVLLERCASVGIEQAFLEWRRGELWPEPTARL